MFVFFHLFQKYLLVSSDIYPDSGVWAYIYMMLLTRGIFFTHGVFRQAGGQATVKVYPGCISETVRCNKLILGRDIG